MYCKQCKKEVESSNGVCSICGSALLDQKNASSSPTRNTIKDLIDRFKQGDQDAYQELYKRTYQRNRYVALKYVHNDAEADDVLQEAYLKVYTKIDQYTYNGEESFASWTSKIVNNTALNHLRTKQPLLFSDVETEDGIEFLNKFEDDREDIQPEISYDKKETSAIVSEIVDTLPDVQRASVMMYYYEEMSVKDIATEFGCSENTVKSRLNYARKSMLSKAESLKKKGMLSGVITVAGLMAILRSKEALAAIHVVSNGAVVSTSLGAAASTGSAASAGTVAGGAGIKITIGAICGAVAITAGAVFMLKTPKVEEPQVVATEAKDSPTLTPSESPKPTPTEKPSIEELYKQYFNNRSGIIKVEGFSFQEFEFGKTSQINFEAKKFSKYKLCDIDKDGTPEMIMKYVRKKDNPSKARTAYMICTVKEGVVVPIFGVKGHVEWYTDLCSNHRIYFRDGALSKKRSYWGTSGRNNGAWAIEVYCKMESGHITMDRCYIEEKDEFYSNGLGLEFNKWKKYDKADKKGKTIDVKDIRKYQKKNNLKHIFGYKNPYFKK